MKFKINGKTLSIPAVILLIVILLISWHLQKQNEPVTAPSVQEIPAFSGEPFVFLNDNEPDFTDEELVEESYEYYSPLDSLGRCGYAMACVGRDIMPTEDRGSISSVKPSGWVQNQYDFVDGKSLYNRCHLIGFQLTGENANERNLITGTRYCNVEGMLPFENMIADYVKETGNHVLYRVTPEYDGDDLVARGVRMEAKSVEDNGAGVCFHVYVYNSQPGVIIDYATGENRAEETAAAPSQEDIDGSTYILNTNSKKFHTEDCGQTASIQEGNRDTYTGDRQNLIDQGYVPAGCCKP